MSKQEKSFCQKVVAFFTNLYETSIDYLSEPYVRETLYRDAGLTPPADKADPSDDLKNNTAQKQKLANIKKFVDKPKPSRIETLMALEDLKSLYQSLRELYALFFNDDTELEDAERTLRFYWSLYSLNLMRLKAPGAYFWMEAIGFVGKTIVELVPGEDVLARFAGLIREPKQYFDSLAEEGNDEQIIETLSHIILGGLAAYIAMMNKDTEDNLVIYGWDPIENSNTPKADTIAARSLVTRVKPAGSDSQVQFGLCAVPESHGGPGPFVTFGMSKKFEGSFTRRSLFNEDELIEWNYLFDISAPSALSMFPSPDVEISDDYDARAILKIQDKATRQHFPDEHGTHLSWENREFLLDISQADTLIKFSMNNSVLVIDKNDCGEILQVLLPLERMQINFDLSICYSRHKGLHLEHGAGFKANQAISKSIGPVKIDQLITQIDAPENADGQQFQFSIGASIATDLRYFKLMMDDVGIQIGPSLTDVGFKPPSSLQLSLDFSKTVKGRGFIFYDKANQQYAGALTLSVGGIKVTAVGLVASIPIGNDKALSILVNICGTSETGLPLAFGFKLNGIGGLIGYNRSVLTNVLRDGIKNKSLDTILFPENALANIAQLASTLASVFPPTLNRHVLGLMALITWGSEQKKLFMELGFLLEIPDPLRLIVLGQIKLLALKASGKHIVKLNMDAIGVFDFQEGTITLDAILHNSKISSVTITGDMAMRVNYKNDPCYLISIGGFHPHFPAPSNVPKLARLAVNIYESKNTKLLLKAYVGLTSNTFQFGANFDFKFKKGSFSVTGNLGADALFQYNPCEVILGLAGDVDIKWKGYTLLGIHLDLTVRGPSTWHITGTAKFEVLCFSKSVSIDRKFGDAPTPTLPTADPMPALIEELNDQQSWTIQIPGTENELVSLIENDSEQIRIHPLGNISVRQSVVPLNIEITRFGNAIPEGTRIFSITDVNVHGQSDIQVNHIKDYFAPAQYLDLSDDESLQRPSFEEMNAGIRIENDSLRFGGDDDASLMTTADFDYETILPAGESEGPRTLMTPQLVQTYVNQSAIAKKLQALNKYKLNIAKPEIEETGFVIVPTSQLSTEPGVFDLIASLGTSYTEAQQLLDNYLATHQEQKNDFQIVKKPLTREASL